MNKSTLINYFQTVINRHEQIFVPMFSFQSIISKSRYELGNIAEKKAAENLSKLFNLLITQFLKFLTKSLNMLHSYNSGEKKALKKEFKY